MIRVVKVGGSLFDWPLLPAAVSAWLNEQPPAINVLIAGGGALADAIRQASRTFALDDESAHWLCIDAMSIHSRLLANVVADAAFISTYSELQSAIEIDSSSRIVFDPNEFLRNQESCLPGCVLPHDWTVSSDSIAARLAEVLSAEELVLLKSADSPDTAVNKLADSGYVDCCFPSFAQCRFRQQFVNLRNTVMLAT